jgi:hypothetical protein
VIAQTVWELPGMSAVVDKGRILTGCTQAPAQDRERAPDDARPQSKVNVVSSSEPLLPHSVEVQHKWTDTELYPDSSFKLA